MNSELHTSCAQKLAAQAGAVSGLTAFLGFDGFVDEIIHVVDKRESPSTFQRIPTMQAFAERLLKAAGKSTNIELVNTRTKLGGNGPIMAHALATFGLRVTYVGTVGYPALHPIFEPLAEKAEVCSIAEACHTDALEFDDGKILFGKSSPLGDVTWANIEERFGRSRFEKKFSASDLVAFVNWTMVPFMSDLWEVFLEEFCPPLGAHRRKLFFDLADPEKRSPRDIERALKLIARFQPYFDVMLGLNEKEAYEVAAVLGHSTMDHSPEGVANLAQQLYCSLAIETLAVHPVTYAVAVGRGRVDVVSGPYVPEPVITTGAGDHFNAGFCLGKLLGYDNEHCLLLGVGTSGFYVGNGRSPGIEDLVAILSNWPSRNLA